MEFHHLKALASQQSYGGGALPGARVQPPSCRRGPEATSRGWPVPGPQAGEAGTGGALISGANAEFSLQGWLITIL